MFAALTALGALVVAGVTVVSALWAKSKWEELEKQNQEIIQEQLEALEKQQLMISVGTGVAVIWASSRLLKQRAEISLGLGIGAFAVQQFMVGRKKREELLSAPPPPPPSGRLISR